MQIVEDRVDIFFFLDLSIKKWKTLEELAEISYGTNMFRFMQ